MLAERMPEAIADRMLDLERYFRENRASRITDDIRRVTGRESRRFAAYVRETVGTDVWSADVTRGRLRNISAYSCAQGAADD